MPRNEWTKEEYKVFLLKLKDGNVLSIASIETHKDTDGNELFIYKTTSGIEGFKRQDQIANFDELSNIIYPTSEPFFPEPTPESTDKEPSIASGSHESNVEDSTKESGDIDILNRCEQQWGKENGMFEECVEQQSEAARWIQDNYSARTDLSKAEYRIITGCIKQWTDQIQDKNNYDYTKIRSCIEQQMQAYKSGQ
jgi:hypothetical protein